MGYVKDDKPWSLPYKHVFFYIAIFGTWDLWCLIVTHDNPRMFGMVLVWFMIIVDTSRTCKHSLYHVVVPDTSDYLTAYHTKSRSQVPKMLDFRTFKKHAYTLFSEVRLVLDRYPTRVSHSEYPFEYGLTGTQPRVSHSEYPLSRIPEYPNPEYPLSKISEYPHSEYPFERSPQQLRVPQSTQMTGTPKCS